MRTNDPGRQKNTLFSLSLSAAAVIVYVTVLFLVSMHFSGWLFLPGAGDRGLLLLARYSPYNATPPYLLGRYHQWDISDPDPAAAIGYYRESLRLNPLQAGAWIDLSKALQAAGRAPEAEHALARAVSLSPNNADLLFEAGTFWLVNNMTDKAVEALRRYITLAPEKQAVVYDLCWKLKLDNGYILQNLLPDAYGYRAGYLRYLMDAGRPAEAGEVWKLLDRKHLEKDTFISYVNFLINNGQYDQARKVWDEISGEIEGMKPESDSSLAWNGGFENDILGGGFDWTIQQAEGARIFVDESVRMSGTRAVGVMFDGRSNPDITVARQVVRVEPGKRYLLRGFIKTEGLTTTNGIFLQVQGHKCRDLNRASEAVTGTNFWKEASVSFEAPAGCRAVTVMIRRARSAKLDNRIEGTAWVDGISLRAE